ncbi:MAG: hypothetical protein ISS57_08415 [Anaerolineales bacterium]|nr:hypothetical protein [Anaerolineales bacterium]
MSLPISEKAFLAFLSKAKGSTYAALEPSQRIEPVLAGSTQYEFRQGALLYRDIYFGMAYFVGQETVYFSSDAIWGMSYAGGVSQEMPEGEMKKVYTFLREALRVIPPEKPIRGPESFKGEGYRYTNRLLGDFKRFSGVETISHGELSVYQLHYSGGLLGGDSKRKKNALRK